MIGSRSLSIECATGVQLAGANAVAISPSGEDVYVTALESNAVTAFTRNPSTGHVAQKSGTEACVLYVLAVGCSLGRAMQAPEDLAASSDGASVYLAAYGSSAIDVLDRSASAGALRQKSRRPGCAVLRPQPDCHAGRAVGRPGGVAVSPDGRSVYLAASGSDAVAVFRRVTPAPPPPGRG